MRILLVAVVAFLLVPVASAKNYKAELLLNPVQPVANVENTLYGCGYMPSSDLDIYLGLYYNEVDASSTEIETTTDANGCFSLVWTPVSTNVDGYYDVWALQENKAGHGYQVKCRIKFTVE